MAWREPAGWIQTSIEVGEFAWLLRELGFGTVWVPSRMFKSFLVYPDDGVWLAEGELLLGSESGEIWRPAGTTSPQGTSAIGCRSFVRLGGLHDQRENRPRSPSGARRRSRARWWVLEAGGGVAVGVQHPQDVEVIGLLDVGDEVREPIHRV